MEPTTYYRSLPPRLSYLVVIKSKSAMVDELFVIIEYHSKFAIYPGFRSPPPYLSLLLSGLPYSIMAASSGCYAAGESNAAAGRLGHTGRFLRAAEVRHCGL